MPPTPTCSHSAAFVNNLNTQVLPTCPEVEGWSLTELVQSVGATRRCNSLLELRALGITAGIGKGRCPVLRPECETIVSGG